MAFGGAIFMQEGRLFFIGSKKSCMQKIKVLTKEMRLFYAFLAIFERDIFADRGGVLNQKGSPRVHWILGR